MGSRSLVDGYIAFAPYTHSSMTMAATPSQPNMESSPIRNSHDLYVDITQLINSNYKYLHAIDPLIMTKDKSNISKPDDRILAIICSCEADSLFTNQRPVVLSENIAFTS